MKRAFHAFAFLCLFGALGTHAQNRLSITVSSSGETTIVATVATGEVRVKQASGTPTAYLVTDSASSPSRVRIEPGGSYSFVGVSGAGYSLGGTVGSLRLVAGGPAAFEVTQLPLVTAGSTVSGLTSDGTTLTFSGSGGIQSAPSAGLGGEWSAPEGTCSTLSASGYDILCADSTAHTVKLSANGGAYAPLGGSALSSLTGATATNSINNGANPQTWNWALTGQNALTITENTAATGASGLVNITTSAGSSAVPLLVKQTSTFSSADIFDVYQGASKRFYVDGNGNTNINTGQLNFHYIGTHVNNADGADNDMSGQIVITSAISGMHTFSQSYVSAPVCTLTPVSDPTATGVWWVTTTTSTVVVNIKTSGTITFNYACWGHGS